MRVAYTGGDIPVNEPDIIAGFVLTYLFEFHPTPLKSRMILARKKVVDDSFGADLYPAYLFKQLLLIHCRELPN
jgi:hypothetical protein